MQRLLDLIATQPGGGADVRLARILVALWDAYERITPHKRADLAKAIIGVIELSCPSETPHPGHDLIELFSGSGGA